MKRLFVQRQSLSANLGLAVAAVLLCLLAGEIAGRILSPTASLWRYPNYIVEFAAPDHEFEAQMRYDPELGHVPVPGFSGLLKNQRLSFAAEGLRNHNLVSPPPAGASILAVGDSFTEGYFVEDDQSWPAHVERALHRPVLNAGVRAYGIDQMVLRAEHLAPRYKPAVMVLAFIPEDIDRTQLSIRDNMHKPYFALAGDGVELRNVPVPSTPTYGDVNLARRVLGHSFLLDFAMRRLRLFELWYGAYTYAHHDGDAVSCRLMTRFAALGRRQHTEALVVALYEDQDWTDASLGADHHRRARALLACAARAGMATLDTWDGFAAASVARRVSDIYYGAHFTNRGNELAARLIATALEPLAK